MAVALLPAMAGLGVGASSASAAPSNAPTAVSGTFDCGGGVTGTFVVNNGEANAPNTWNVAHLTFLTNGIATGTGVFVPNGVDLTFTSPSGDTFSDSATKKSFPGPDTCSISASEGGFTLQGAVSGTIVVNG